MPNPAEFLKNSKPFLSVHVANRLREYSERYNVYSSEIDAAGESAATAEFDRRVAAARENPCAENFAALNRESSDELRKKYADRKRIYVELRDRIVAEFAPELCRQIRPVLVSKISEYRTQCDSEFRALHGRWEVPYNPAENIALRGIDHWLSGALLVLDREESCRINRAPGPWEPLLATPGELHSVIGENAAAADQDAVAIPQAQPVPAAGALRTAVETVSQPLSPLATRRPINDGWRVIE
jgi:hypothetical protein